MGTAPPRRNNPSGDLTEAQAAASATASDGQFQALFESALDAILILDDARVYVDANPAACRLCGTAYEELIGRRLDDFVDPDVRGELDERWRLFMERGSGKGELQIIRPDESVRDVEITSRARFVPGRHLAILRDITEQKVAEEALQASEERFFIAFNANANPMCIYTHQEQGFLEVNDSFLTVSGYSREEIIGSTAAGIGLWVDERGHEAAIATLDAHGAVRNAEVELRTKSGETRSLLVSLERIEIDGVNCVLETSTDITERKRLEEQLQQSQRLESVGRLAGGVAHDFNNLLTVISGYCDLALKRVAEDDPWRKDILEIRKASDRATALTRQLLAYSRKQLLSPRLLDLNVAVAEMSRMLVRLIGEDVELDVVLDPLVGRIKADPGQIEQVLANLAVNARDAMPEGGRITIETRNAELDDRSAKIRFEGQPCDYVLLSVADTGQGMSAETQGRIFEPFFTTKEQGKGTGLGLSTVYGIVTQSGGLIDVESVVGGGTTFRVYLPRVLDDTVVVAGSDVSTEPAEGSETLLVVEDEPEVRRFVVETLARYGYQVLEAMDGSEALAILERQDPKVALVVTDVVMPKMSGRQLADRAARIQPAARILYISGHTESSVVHHGVLDEGIAFLAKPFTPDTLARKVRELLDDK